MIVDNLQIVPAKLRLKKPAVNKKAGWIVDTFTKVVTMKASLRVLARRCPVLKAPC